MSVEIGDMFDLSGRVAIVTGGSRGLGRAMVEGFARAGADVAIVSRKLDACTQLADEVSESTGRSCLAQACDVGRWEGIEEMLDAVYDHFGRLDIVVNNAGMSPAYPSLAEVTESLFDKVMDVNLKGPFRLAALTGTRMVDSGGGSIINISSMNAKLPQPNALPYSMAKAGLNAMTAGLALAFGPAVRVNAIMAGSFHTDLTAHWSPKLVAHMERATALRRMGGPEEIVGTAVLLASDASSFTTGAVLAVDGGVSLAP